MKTDLFRMRIEPSLLEQVRGAAAADGLTMTSLVRLALMRWLRENGYADAAAA